LIAIGVVLMASARLVPGAYAQTSSSLTCSPSTIAGGSGGSSTCTVTLSAAAPAGGTLVTLTSSNIELAASAATIRVPAGQTAKSFTVGTNAGYRRYSGLAFSSTIGASANGTTRSATLNVTPPPPPADFNSGSQGGSNTQWSGLMCGGIAPIGGYPDILYDCSPASGTGFGSCTFFRECSQGCRRVPPNRGTFNDFCATTGPNPVAINRNYIVGGDRVASAIVAEAPAGAGAAQEQGVPRIIDPNFNSTKFPQSGIGFPTGASSVPFDVATSLVPAIQFVEVGGFWFNDAIPPFLITNGRGGHAWLAMVPPDPAPSVAIPTLGDFKITGSNPVTGGDTTIGQIDLSGLSRAGGPTITITSSHPAIVPSMSVVSPASEQVFGYQAFIATQPPSADTDVTVTATDGRYSFSAVLRVLKPAAAAVLSGVSVNPSSVVGGNSSTGTVTLSAAQSGATFVALSTPAPASVATMPASVTVPAGATSATFSIATSPVTETFNMNIFADLAGSPERQALLLINPGAQTLTLSSLSLSPSSVVGGASSTGTVTLSGAAPGGGAAVSLSDNSSATAVPASVTVSAGATSANFTVTTTSVTASTSATISAAFGGVTKTAALTVNPPAQPAPAAPTLVSPAASSTPAQPVAFDWTDVANAATYEIQIDNTSTISSPFVASATVTVSQATIGGLPAQQLWWRVRARNSAGVAGAFSATRSFTPTSAPSGQPVPLTVAATGRSGERVTSSPSGINVAVGASGTASFATGTAITLSVSNGRDAIWSGACSSGGNKRRTCTFTITATASVTANVQ
jgi:hypothetical protein